MLGFNREYAVGYDVLSGDTRNYEVWTENLARRLLDFKPKAQDVLEIGSGTGNSATVLLEQAPNLKHVFGVEANDFILLANAKRQGELSKFFDPLTPPEYSQEIQRRLQMHKDKFFLIKAKGEALPVKSESMDAVFMVQVFHWLNSKAALSEISRVLKSDGIMVFDESEYQFDFGDSIVGKEIKKRQTTNHPFFRLFQVNLSQEIKRLQSTVPIQPFVYQFTLESLKTLLEDNGFELLPSDNGELYTISQVSFTHEQIVSMARYTAQMKIMAQAPELLKTPGLVEQLIQKALEQTELQWAGTSDQDDRVRYGGSQAAFVARKCASKPF